VGSGGEAKIRIQEGEVKVNGAVCTMRGKKLREGDTAQMGEYLVTVTQA
jgi:ribosome-associated protein